MAATDNSPLIRPVGCGVGADISGVDLTRPVSDKVIAKIREAFVTYGVVFFRDQHLGDDQHRAFTERFGEVLTVQELRKEPDQTRNIGESWHVDMTFRPDPPMATMLVARELPAYGGDTLWANMTLAYAALSDGLKATLRGMRAVHANVRNLGLSYDQTAPPEPGPDAYDAAEGSLHPVVAEHPESGRPVLYVNSEYTARFEGWTRRESLGLLSYLFGHGQRPEFGVRLRWRPGTIAFWDNRQVWHLAVNDYQGMRRVMSRSMIKGFPPIPAG